MQEAARGGILLPIILLVSLKEKHIRPEVRSELVLIVHQYFDSTSFSVDSRNFRSV
ncbi:hypothetical protein V8C42DRAFT_322291 [Trichoderma barbatum]